MEPSWPKLVEPLEKIVDQLTVVWGMINHLKSVKDTSELRSAIEEVQVCFYFRTHPYNMFICIYVFNFSFCCQDILLELHKVRVLFTVFLSLGSHIIFIWFSAREGKVSASFGPKQTHLQCIQGYSRIS